MIGMSSRAEDGELKCRTKEQTMMREGDDELTEKREEIAKKKNCKNMKADDRLLIRKNSWYHFGIHNCILVVNSFEG